MIITIQNRLASPRLSCKEVRFFVKQICRGLGCTERAGVPELSVWLTGDARMRQLNRKWRDKNIATDVLAFSQIEDRTGSWGEGPPTCHAVWGDVVISYDTAARQARALGHSLSHEVKVLLVHGILHLLGYDHVHDAVAAQRMQAAENRLLRYVATAQKRRQAERP